MSSEEGTLLNEGQPLIVKTWSDTYSIDARGTWPDWQKGDKVHLSSTSGSVELTNHRSMKSVSGWVTRQ